MRGKSMFMAVVTAGAVASQPALAQTAAPAATGEQAQGLEEIIVTAQKRDQNMQSVPVSVTALTADALAKQRIGAFTDLTRAAASLTITQQTNATSSSINLRGIGTYAFSISVEPSVAVIVDDMPVVQQAQAFSNLSDLARIEVLKGPQGTLFGKAASAGVVNIVTQDPTDHFTGRASVTAATDSDYRVEAGLSGPVGDSVGYRVSGFYHSYAGNMRNLTDGSLLNDEESYGGRVKVKFQPSDGFSYTINGSYALLRQAGTGLTIRSITPGSTPIIQNVAGVPLSGQLGGITPGAGNYATRVDTPGSTISKTSTISGRGVLDLGSASLISVTSFQDWRYNFRADVDGTAADVNAVLTNGAVHGGIVQSGPYHSTSFTQELRLASQGRGRLKYLLGAFYADSNTDRSFQRGPVALLSAWDGQAGSQSAAAFAQLEYAVPTGTTFTGGLRFNHEHISAAYTNTLSNATPATCVAGTAACRGTHNDDVVTWKGSISQQLHRGVMAYASVATGYKGWAYDVSSGFTPARANGTTGPVKAEHSTAYELGIKSRFLDNRVQLNVTGFWTDYNNFQGQSAVVVNNAIQLVLNNVGRVRTKGIEGEFSAKPTNWLRFDASAAYTEAGIRSFMGAQAYSGQLASSASCTTAAASGLCSFQDRSGGRLPNSPRFKFNIGATGEVPLGQSGAKGTFTLNYQHQSSVNFDLLGNPLTVQGAYGVLNGSVGLETGNITLSLFANNLFNTHFASNLSDSFSSMGGTATNPAHVINQFLSRDSQRYAGIKLGYKF
ncbi:TonB-dependent receptor [Novosphingobium rosa]|uniref:TonB-dependent receptor n=1 Tax=Novosphingobium rosa TaxID=76978 RepID=UPI00082F15AE|nr:TonB-dependent receptor [Novosphingobium rosa]